MTKETYKRKNLMGPYSYKEWLYDHQDRECEAGCARTAAGSLYVVHKHEARELTGNGVRFWNCKVQWHTSSNKATPPTASQAVLIPGDQIFKHESMKAVLIQTTIPFSHFPHIVNRCVPLFKPGFSHGIWIYLVHHVCADSNLTTETSSCFPRYKFL